MDTGDSSAIMKHSIIFLSMILVFNTGCASVGEDYVDAAPPVWIKNLVSKCVAEQLSASTSFWDVDVGRSRNKFINSVNIVKISKLDVLYIDFNVIPVFPDAPHALCQFDTKANAVIRVAYIVGEPGAPENKDIVLDRQLYSEYRKRTEELTDKAFEKLLKDAKKWEYPLNVFEQNSMKVENRH